MLVVVEVIVAPDSEALVIAYLNTAYTARSNAVRASTEVPTPRPVAFVRILRVGGTSTLVIDRPTFAVESWADDPITAYNNAALTRGLIHAIDKPGTSQFYDPQEFSGPANLPDPESGQARYTQTISVGVRQTAL